MPQMDLSNVMKFANMFGRIAQLAGHWDHAISHPDGIFADHGGSTQLSGRGRRETNRL
jgi:hypothetical protein